MTSFNFKKINSYPITRNISNLYKNKYLFFIYIEFIKIIFYKTKIKIKLFITFIFNKPYNS